jgi:hypothetical protein
VETQIDANKNTRKTDDKNRTKTQFMSSQAFHQTPDMRVQEITAGGQFGLANLKLFYPVALE